MSVALSSSAGFFHCTDLSRYDRAQRSLALGGSGNEGGESFFGFAGGAASASAVECICWQMSGLPFLTPSHTQWQPRTFRDAMQELGYREDINFESHGGVR